MRDFALCRFLQKSEGIRVRPFWVSTSICLRAHPVSHRLYSFCPLLRSKPFWDRMYYSGPMRHSFHFYFKLLIVHVKPFLKIIPTRSRAHTLYNIAEDASAYQHRNMEGKIIDIAPQTANKVAHQHSFRKVAQGFKPDLSSTRAPHKHVDIPNLKIRSRKDPNSPAF